MPQQVVSIPMLLMYLPRDFSALPTDSGPPITGTLQRQHHRSHCDHANGSRQLPDAQELEQGWRDWQNLGTAHSHRYLLGHHPSISIPSTF